MLEYNDDEYKVIVLVDDPNNNPKALAGNLCDTQNLTNEMNFSKKMLKPTQCGKHWRAD
jgi:hypothetical protein